MFEKRLRQSERCPQKTGVVQHMWKWLPDKRPGCYRKMEDLSGKQIRIMRIILCIRNVDTYYR